MVAVSVSLLEAEPLDAAIGGILVPAEGNS